MAYETKDNSGSLFKREKQNDKQPDYSGPCMVNGKLLELAAWIKESAAGKKYMSLKFSEPRTREAQKPSGNNLGDDLSDEVPF